MCTLSRVTLQQLGPTQLRVRLVGSRFLYKMARNSVGAIVRVGSGELSLDEVQHALRHGAFERSRSLPLTAPAHGLVLQRVAFAPEDDPFTGAGVVGERDEEDERAVCRYCMNNENNLLASRYWCPKLHGFCLSVYCISICTSE